MPQIFGPRVRDLRKEKQWSQTELANKLKVSQQTVASYEKGDKFPGQEILIKVAKVFNTSLDYLVGLSDVKERLTEEELKFASEQSEVDLMKIVETKRPTVNGVPVDDDHLEIIVGMLETIHQNQLKKRK